MANGYPKLSCETGSTTVFLDPYGLKIVSYEPERNERVRFNDREEKAFANRKRSCFDRDPGGRERLPVANLQAP